MGEQTIAIDKTFRSLRHGRRHPGFQQALKNLHAASYRLILPHLLPILDRNAEGVLGEFFVDFLRRRRYLDIPARQEDAEKWFFREVSHFILNRVRGPVN
ncbi:MAG: hypothetical protein D6795_04050 [Deltaproteobacteria bacterium]|nr:MAG: hypothetical protein D6795_04050 [Deltaproteobacteria bacterium]